MSLLLFSLVRGLSSGIRVNKCLAAQVSRREADRLCQAGRVMINGAVASPGDRVLPGDVLTLDGAPVALAADEAHSYVKYWKPRGIECTTSDAPGTLASAVLDRLPTRCHAVGRLDKDSEGLVLLTSDGRVTNALLKSKQRKEKVYEVTTARGVANAHLAQLRRGIMLTTPTRGDKTLTALTLPCEVTRLGSASFRIVLTEGRNQQIRRMCKALSLGEVKRLHRVSVAGINLDGLEGPGEWAALDEREQALIEAQLDDVEDDVEIE